MVTIDTNIAVYALTQDDKCLRAREVLRLADFVSVQLLNEYASVARRKLGRDWDAVKGDLALIRNAVGTVCSLTNDANSKAIDIADRYQISFYDALMVSVAVANGGTRLYSEDMQHGLVIEEALTIINPFLLTETS